MASKKFEKGSYIDCISFQVYVDYAYAENFLANNQLYFYFSNPPKSPFYKGGTPPFVKGR